MNTRNSDPFLDDVEKIDGIPLVLSPYGFKKVVIEGRKYLMPYEEAELAHELATMKRATFEQALTSLRAGKGSCYNEVMWGPCFVGTCKKRCEKVSTSAGWTCSCNT